MEPTRTDPGLDVLRRRRAELRESMSALEQALAAPTPGRADAWRERLCVALVELSADVREHIAITEGPGGLHRDIVATSPRLAHAVDELGRDHAVIHALIEDLIARGQGASAREDVDAIRPLGTTLLGRLVRHRQKGADLVYEAYQADIGGET